VLRCIQKQNLKEFLNCIEGMICQSVNEKKEMFLSSVHLVIQGYITIANAMERMLLLVDTEL